MRPTLTHADPYFLRLALLLALCAALWPLLSTLGRAAGEAGAACARASDTRAAVDSLSRPGVLTFHRSAHVSPVH
jgi:hypothetical protein